MSGFPPPKKRDSISGGPYRESVNPSSGPPQVPCPFCGLAIDPSTARCPRCAVDLDFARCPKCLTLGALGERSCARCGADLPRMVSGEATDAPCPRCSGKLSPLEMHDAVDAFHECKSCRGVFLGHHTFATAARKLAAGEPLPPILTEYVEPAPDQVTYLKCPCCGRQMNRRRLARMVVDVCKLHGTWFDRGEVVRVLAPSEEKDKDKEAPAPAKKPLPPEARAAVARAQVEAGVETHALEEDVGFLRSLLAVLFGV